MELDYSRMVAESGHYKTQGLFYEYRFQSSSDYLPYTLKERDYKGHRSMYKIYMACDSEYEAAIKLLNSWKHWEILIATDWFSKEVDKWREEREIRELALGKSVLVAQAEEGNVTAAKALVDGSKRKAGRPSKNEIKAELKKKVKMDNKVSSLVDRMERTK